MLHKERRDAKMFLKLLVCKYVVHIFHFFFFNLHGIPQKDLNLM
jgi:hypothetical protein